MLNIHTTVKQILGKPGSETVYSVIQGTLRKEKSNLRNPQTFKLSNMKKNEFGTSWKKKGEGVFCDDTWIG